MARLAYLGTPEMAVPPLRALVDAGHEIALCVTRPDRRRGRGGQTTPSPVKAAATELGLPVTHDMDELLGAGVELAVVVAYGRIIPGPLLERVPMVNLHFSLLPRWRGAAPVERAILAGDSETGVCLMRIEEGLDSGPVYAERRVPIDEDEALPELRARLVTVGSALLVEALTKGPEGLPVPQPQEGEVTIANKVTVEDLHLDWAQSARQLTAWCGSAGPGRPFVAAAAGPRGRHRRGGSRHRRHCTRHTLRRIGCHRRWHRRARTGATREPFPHVSGGVAARRASGAGRASGTD